MRQSIPTMGRQWANYDPEMSLFNGLRRTRPEKIFFALLSLIG